MKNLHLKLTEDTPEIKLDAVSGELLIAGKHLLEDAGEFYQPVIDWLHQYEKSPCVKTSLNVKILFFISSEGMFLYRFFNCLDAILQKGYEAEVNWFFLSGDEDMEEAGREFSEIVNVPFNFYAYED